MLTELECVFDNWSCRLTPVLPARPDSPRLVFLARYSGPHPRRVSPRPSCLFQWAHDVGLEPLDATRPTSSCTASWLEERGLAASTIDRRLSTVCGFLPVRAHRRTHRVEPGPVRPPPSGAPVDCAAGWTVASSASFLFTAERFDHGPRRPGRAARAQRPAGQRSLRHQHRGPRLRTRPPHPADRRQGQQARHRSRSCPAPPAPSTSPSANATKARSCCATTANDSTAAPPTAGSGPSANEPGSDRSTPTCSEPRSSWPPSTPASPYATSRSPPATPTREPPPSTTADARTSTATPPTSSSPSSPAADPARRGGKLASRAPGSHCSPLTSTTQS